MHIPDGFLAPGVAAATAAASAGAVALAARRSAGELQSRRAPLVGLTSAFILAAQMVNFPVTGGTSGHLMGGGLAAALLGPWAGMLSMATVLLVQAVLFGDGGITALGANVLNMAVIGVLVAHALTRAARAVLGGRTRHLPLAAGLGAAVSVEASALATAAELALSDAAPARLAFAVMGGIHALIAVAEGLITAALVAYLASARPDLLPDDEQRRGSWWVPVAATVMVAGVLSMLASALPDGLEWAAGQLGLVERTGSAVPAPLPDYTVPGLAQLPGRSLAGILGAVAAFGAAYLLVRAGERRRETA
ncbi:energy-coupling factor ABC transporter permease [Carboxydichorda subterranea]|uniref:energy-coupling factor ABC transporter permease n=1 Tax=Carboxydichorda subterranea TaxID=3109565 RepID=UPI003857B80E